MLIEKSRLAAISKRTGIPVCQLPVEKARLIGYLIVEKAKRRLCRQMALLEKRGFSLKEFGVIHAVNFGARYVRGSQVFWLNYLSGDNLPV